jgi:cytosine/adenosine deaminase-related metal-dependent hydrolase
MILTNARILTFDGENRVLDSGSVEVGADGTIGLVRSGRSIDADAIDLHGRLLMPALINCHTHLYSALARGLRLPGPAPADFPAILKKLWWRLDRALNEEDVYSSALIGLIDSAKCGVATVVDHHSSPNACAGSLDRIEQAFREVGLRGATCYEVSDRNGKRSAQEGIRENIRFLERVRPAGFVGRAVLPAAAFLGGFLGPRESLLPGERRLKDVAAPASEACPIVETHTRYSDCRGSLVGAMFGLHASFTLSDRTLQECVEANQSFDGGFHVHVAEDLCDRQAVRRLCRFGVLDDKALAAHCVHVTAAERGMLGRRRVNVVHNPQSNCINAVGIANLPALCRAGACVGLGSDGCTPRIWDEFKAAYHLQKLRNGGADALVRARPPGRALALSVNSHAGRRPSVADDVFRAAFHNSREIVTKIWGLPVGRIESGARADLLVLDYFPPSPIGSDNLFGHLLFGISSAPVDALMVDGRWVVRDGHCVNIDERQIAERAAARAKALWERL